MDHEHDLNLRVEIQEEGDLTRVTTLRSGGDLFTLKS